MALRAESIAYRSQMIEGRKMVSGVGCQELEAFEFGLFPRALRL